MVKRKFKHKFGSVAWQREVARGISKKLMKGQRLDDYDKAFIDVQSEIFKRRREEERKKLRSIAC